MPAPFAALEARLNRAVGSRLPNAEAVYQGGLPFGVIFDTNAATWEEGVESVGPQAAFLLSLAPGLKQDHTLTIGGTPYKVTGGLKPDSSGWATVQLRRLA